MLLVANHKPWIYPLRYSYKQNSLKILKFLPENPLFISFHIVESFVG
jgi:hypothetical protein